MDEYRKLKKQPLKIVLAEFCFPELMKMEELIPEIQDDLRTKFPIFEKKEENAIVFKPGSIGLESQNRWSFISADKRSAIGIGRGKIFFCTAVYPGYEKFSEECKDGLEILLSHANLALIERVGLRYGNLMELKDQASLAEIVDPQFGFPNCLKDFGTARQKSNEIVVVTLNGVLLIRTFLGKSDLLCLRDLKNLPISLDNSEQPSHRFILDLDHFWENKGELENFHIGGALERLALLHETSREVFWKVTKKEARENIWS